MASPKVVFLSLMLLVGIACAFNASDYLYPYENGTIVSYSNFTLKGIKYSIVSLDGDETFLLKNGQILQNKSEIESATYSYYLSTYYPSDDDVDNLRDLIDAYNESRNDGQKFIGKEEYTCRSVLFIDGRVMAFNEKIYCRDPSDEKLCNYSAMLMYQYLSSLTTPPVGSWDDLAEPIMDFGYSSYGTDEILGEAVSRLNDAKENEAKMLDALDYIDDNIETLDDYREEIENSKFGWTEKKACDANHWCLCPDMDLNDSILDDLGDAAKDLVDKMEPFKNYKIVSSEIYNNTKDRVEYTTTEKLVAQYYGDFTSMNGSGGQIIALGEEATLRVSNTTLANELFQLKSLHQSISDDLEDKDTSTLGTDIERYGNLTQSVNISATSLLEQYNDTKDAKNLANSLIYVLESKDLDPVAAKTLSQLENQSGDLDAEFRDGLALAKLVDLEGNYTALAREAQALLMTDNDMPANRVLLLFRGYARAVNENIANLAEATQVVERKDIPDNSLTLVIFSALVFISMASILLLVFLHIMATTRFTIPKAGQIVASAFVCLMVLLLGFSAVMYLFLGKTSTDATLPEFLSDFNKQRSATILLDLRNTSYSDSLAMSSCAASLADSFGDRNKTWTLYTLTANSCSRKTSTGGNSTLSTDDCVGEAENSTSLFKLGYSSSNEEPRFSVIYENKAEITANLDYYESCPVVSLFS